MKLRARITKRQDDGTHRWIQFVFPADRQWPFYAGEKIIARNIGPRPWSEAFWVNDQGERVITYGGRQR